MDDELHQAVAERLAAEGQRYTSNRRAMVEILEGTDHPLTTAEMLTHRRLAQSSVYRNLALLEQVKVVHRVTSTDEFARFELAEDLTNHHHHHLICSACGAVADFTVEPALERSLAKAMERVSDGTGFRAEHHRLDLVGTCRSCS